MNKETILRALITLCCLVILYQPLLAVDDSSLPYTDLVRPTDLVVATDLVRPVDIPSGAFRQIQTPDLLIKYGSYVDDIYCVQMDSIEAVNSMIVIDDTYYDCADLLKDIVIGSATIFLCCVALPEAGIAIGGERVAYIFTSLEKTAAGVIKEAMIGAAISAGIDGIISASKGESLDEIANSVIQGAGEGFKWTAVLASASRVASFTLKYCNRTIDFRGVEKVNGKYINTKTGIEYVPKIAIDSNGKFVEILDPKFESFGGVPVFSLPKELWQASDYQQMKNATKQLWQFLESNPSYKSGFTANQLDAISKGRDVIPGLTWNHMVEKGQLQLVDGWVHSHTYHAPGGKTIWGGGAKNR